MRDSPPSWDVPLVRRALAEALGTAILVGAGTGAVAVDSLSGGIGVGGVAAAFGLGVMISIFALGHLSGAHLNPAVSLGFVAIGRLSFRDAFVYIVAQVAGALAASLGIRVALGGEAALGVTQPSLVGAPGAFLVEIILTAVLMIVIVSVATDTRASGALAAVAIGGTVAAAALVMGPVEGASMNPARSLAPALVEGEFRYLAIYLVAPIIGGVIGALSYRYLSRP